MFSFIGLLNVVKINRQSQSKSEAYWTEWHTIYIRFFYRQRRTPSHTCCSSTLSACNILFGRSSPERNRIQVNNYTRVTCVCSGWSPLSANEIFNTQRVFVCHYTPDFMLRLNTSSSQNEMQIVIYNNNNNDNLHMIDNNNDPINNK